MKKLLPLLALLALTACKQTTAPMAETPEETLNIPECTVTAPPDSLQLDPFYTKYVDVNGLPLISSWRVPDSAYWFNVNAEMPYTDGKHNWCNTREELQQFDPDLYALLAEYFPNTKLQISKHKKVNEIGKY